MMKLQHQLKNRIQFCVKNDYNGEHFIIYYHFITLSYTKNFKRVCLLVSIKFLYQIFKKTQ